MPYNYRINFDAHYYAQEGVKGVVQVDNLDRLTSLGTSGELLAIEFLRDGPAQPVFSTMLQSGLTVLLSIHEEWIDKIKRDPKFSYLGNLIELTSLNGAQCRELITKRLQSYFLDAEKQISDIFESAALGKISRSGRGKPRKLVKVAMIRFYRIDIMEFHFHKACSLNLRKVMRQVKEHNEWSETHRSVTSDALV